MNNIGVSAMNRTLTCKQMRQKARDDDRLCRAPISGVLEWLYGAARGPGASTLRRWLIGLLRRLEGGEMRSITLRSIMSRFHGVQIGAHSYGCFDPVRFPPATRVGRYVSVGPQVEIYRRNHPLDRLSLHPYFYNPTYGAAKSANVGTAPLEIGADAWLGARAIVLPGCNRIGRGAVIAAGAVVTREVPDYAVVGGNPARVIRMRLNAEEIRAAEHSGWWELSPDQVSQRFDTASSWHIKTSDSLSGCPDE